jgi:hypothetical protein
MYTTHTLLPSSTCSTCSDTILSSAIASSIAISLSVKVTTLSPNAAAISSNVLRLVSLFCLCQLKDGVQGKSKVYVREVEVSNDEEEERAGYKDVVVAFFYL